MSFSDPNFKIDFNDAPKASTQNKQGKGIDADGKPVAPVGQKLFASDVPFKDKKLHPGELKPAMVNVINRLLDKIRSREAVKPTKKKKERFTNHRHLGKDTKASDAPASESATTPSDSCSITFLQRGTQ
ncbi:hypothetical protein BT96DRAFT_1007799 [Gymnopus androsaceus JB14]|uniref:Uncharacterized protein n=1 Tax=Gymnopus androsaceus JB14 TaxID=1447944 RepID=A0A6A4GGW6_9AGAR|nr:hypothetical protein BT96DRAFT_1007799 [Gymnopus androsaceus JB14]